MILRNNPAGRLYSLFGRLRDVQTGVPIVEAWSQILGYPQDVVREQLGSVAQLVLQIDVAVEPPDREQIAAPVKRYRNQWLEAAFPLQRSFSDAVDTIRPSDEAYEALGTVAAYLGEVAPDGEIPSDERHSELMENLQAVIDEVSHADDLPEEIAHLILSRLSDVQTAMWHIEIGGPNAVRSATETLIGAVVARSTDEKNRKAGTTKRVLAVAGTIWVAFSSGPMVQKSIEAWPEVVHELAASTDQVAAAHQDGRADAEPHAVTEHGGDAPETQPYAH